MSNAVKHKQRSHYSYRNNNAAVFSGFESRATRKKCADADRAGVLLKNQGWY